MTQEDKQLLLKDLCCRLPYGVKVQDELGRVNKLVIGNADLIRLFYNDFSIYRENALSLPLLRPMSNMTEEDNLSLSRYVGCSIRAKYGEIYFPNIEDNTLGNWEKVFKWLFKNHFDYHGLIEKGLAIEAPEGIYK